MNEERIGEALRALACHDRELQAAPAVEKLLIQRMRKQRNGRWRRRMALAGAAAASLVVAAFVTAHRSPHVSSPVPLPEAEDRVVVAPAPAIVVAPKQVQRARVARSQNTREIVTDFIPWMDSALPFQGGQLLRVELPADVMRTVGLPVHEDHLGDLVQADVLVGEDGLPRAIRFVKSDMQ